MFVVFFFFKQKTAYEMRISDWSSDVCSSDLTFIVGANGRPLTKESFGNEFKAACKAAGVPGSAHGVRKIAATRAADNGATEAQLMAIFGWTDTNMAAHYTRTANRQRPAPDARGKLNAGGTSPPPTDP